ncbi:phosphonoacetaldehyde dehydrogenase, partial [Burkholderia cenocepacia]|nr:phosphonoacetaldehyde dehydrogenase [Burkholderia cenocepacia]MDS0805397.1 phosphonoacetaldehyde dehydrogenase [Burkholderia cenocepacia]
MSTVLKPIPASDVRHEALRIDGQRVWRDAVIDVRNPYDGALVGTVPKATLDDVRRA